LEAHSPLSGRNARGEKIIEQEVDRVGSPGLEWNGDFFFFVLIAQESVSWRIARKRVERMRKEGPVVMVVISHFRVTGVFLPSPLGFRALRRLP